MSSARALAQIIGAIGDPGFPAVAAGAVGGLVGFDLAAVVIHGRGRRPALLFDNFDLAGGRQGIETYVRVTHAANPILARPPAAGAFRARDFARRPPPRRGPVARHTVPAPEEELGFRTIGWPERLEEIGLHLEVGDGIVEFGFYRQRRARPATLRDLRPLDDLQAPIAAAFDKHLSLSRAAPPAPGHGVLSPREGEVAGLLLAGCSSDAVAARLAISRHTVKDHRKRIFRKLGIGSLAELFAWCRATTSPPSLEGWRGGAAPGTIAAQTLRGRVR
ncbi:MULTISPECIES: helix-turn-helix transcriptional regulator [unclassified Inquilinus]|uniref:helix-turn-helix transcriptional regulator n=1 Tax=unclassified Inquilinus TaxID=2645927 RepID=UPI003F91DDEC